jgi:hypothetical protein
MDTRKDLESIEQEILKRREEHSSGKASRRLRRRLVRLAVGVLAVVLFVGGGWFLYNFFRLNGDLVEGHIKQKMIPNLFGGDIVPTVGGVTGNLIHGVELRNLQIVNSHFPAAGILLSVPRVALKYSLFDALWGKLVLEKVQIDDPVLTLSRAPDGRAIWNFASGPADVSGKPPSRRGSGDPQAQAEVLADRYLRNIDIRNLSIVAPQPRDLFPDRTVARLLRLPPGNLNLNGIGVRVEKSWRGEHSHHVMRVTTPKSGNLAMLQWSRHRTSGNFNVSIDAWSHRMILDVRNVGELGRRIQLYDERDKNRLLLNFGLTRPGRDLMRRVIGPKGHLRIPDLSGISALIPLENTIKGGIVLELDSTREDQPLFESEFGVKITDLMVSFGEMTPLKSFSLDLAMKNRLADVRRLALDYGDVSGIHSGTIDLTAFPVVQASMSSRLNEEPMSFFTTVGDRQAGCRHVAVRAARAAGFLEIDFDQQNILGMEHYRNLRMRGEIHPGQRISDLVPSRLFPPLLARRWDEWIGRVDLIGPLAVNAEVPSPEKASLATISLMLHDAVIVNRLQPEQRANLSGRVQLADRMLVMEALGARIDEFRVEVGGRVKIDETLKKPEFYDISADCSLTGDRPFSITGKRFQETLGLAHPPPFKSLVIEGGELAKVRLTSREEPQSLQLNIPAIRVLLGKKIFWIRNLAAGFLTTSRLDLCGFRPANLDVNASSEVFGFPFRAKARVNVAGQTLDHLAVTGTGEHFGKVLEAMREHPDFGPVLRQYPVQIDGKFAMELTATGRLNRPEVFGSLRFPALGLKILDFSGKFPFEVGISSEKDGEYQGKIKAGKAKLSVKGVDFQVQNLEGELSYGKSGKKGQNALGLKVTSAIFGTQFKGQARFIPLSETIEQGSFVLSTQDIAPLVGEISRFAGFNMPFRLTGPFRAGLESSGPLKRLKSKIEAEVGNLHLHVPLTTLTGKPEVLKVENISGKVTLARDGAGLFSGEIGNGKAMVLGAPLTLAGKIHLDKQENGYVPRLDGLEAAITGMAAAGLLEFLDKGFAMPDAIKQFGEVDGKVSGKLQLAGAKNRFTGEGEVTLNNGQVRYAGLPERLQSLSGTMVFSRKKVGGVPELEIKGLTGSCGRARFSIPAGKVSDPGKTGRIELEGIVEQLFPSEWLKLLAAYQLPNISFPKEGPWSGRVKVSGALTQPVVTATVEGKATEVCYRSGSGDYTLPIGENSIQFVYDVRSGRLTLDQSVLRFLQGEVKLVKAVCRFSGGGLKEMEIDGVINHVDIGSLGTPGKALAKGKIGGTFRAERTIKGSNEALGHLKFDHLVISGIPLDAAAIQKIGVDFLDEPEFTIGEINLFVSSEGDSFERGRLRVADGLFAGPNLRLELSESSFDPSRLQLTGKLVINPQPLRRTKLGKKLGSLTRVLQERERGLPYVDLTVSGTWDKPEMMAKVLVNQNKKRGKRNFIKSIFGGRGTHKATVEELKEWFPGWEPGQ